MKLELDADDPHYLLTDAGGYRFAAWEFRHGLAGRKADALATTRSGRHGRTLRDRRPDFRTGGASGTIRAFRTRTAAQ